MKRMISFLTALAVISLSGPCFADPIAKIKGGVKDVIMSPLHVPDSVKAETKVAKFMPFGLAGGLLKGGFYMAKDIVTGSLDVVTAPLDLIKK